MEEEKRGWRYVDPPLDHTQCIKHYFFSIKCPIHRRQNIEAANSKEKEQREHITEREKFNPSSSPQPSASSSITTPSSSIHHPQQLLPPSITTTKLIHQSRETEYRRKPENREKKAGNFRNTATPEQQ